MYKKFYRAIITDMPNSGSALKIKDAITDTDGLGNYDLIVTAGDNSSYDVDTTGITDLTVYTKLLKDALVKKINEMTEANRELFSIDVDSDIYIYNDVEIHLRGLFALDVIDDVTFNNVVIEFNLEETEFKLTENIFMYDDSDCNAITYRFTANDSIIKRMIEPTQLIYATPQQQVEDDLFRTGEDVKFKFISLGGLFIEFTKYFPRKITVDDYKLRAERLLDGKVEFKVTGKVKGVYPKYKFAIDRASTGYEEFNYSHSVTNLRKDGEVNDIATVFIKDQFGCEIRLDTAVIKKEREPYFKVSKSNSLRFIDTKELKDCEFKTEENESICEWNNNTNSKYKQLFTKCDVIKTQYRTNYNGMLRMMSRGGSEISAFTTLVKKNLGVEDYRTAQLKLVETIPTATPIYVYRLYYLKGDILNDIYNPIGKYNIGKYLPEFIKTWQRLTVWIDPFTMFNITIDSIIYDDDLGVYCIEFNSTVQYNDIKTGCIYDAEDYNVYEFNAYMENMFNLGNDLFLIESNDSEFDKLTYTTEPVEIIDKNDRVLKIEYWNDSDTDTINKIHHIQNYIKTSKKAEQEISGKQNITDQSVQKYNTQIMELTEYDILPIPFQMYRRLSLALNHEHVLINDMDSKYKSMQHSPAGKSNMTKCNFVMYKNKI